MQSDLKAAKHDGIHPIFRQEHGLLFRQEDCKVQDSLSKLNFSAQQPGPHVESMRPILFILVAVIAAVPKKSKLVLAKFETVNARQFFIKWIQRGQAGWIVVGDFFAKHIIEAKRVVDTLVGHDGIVNQFGEETVLNPKLGFFEKVILVLRKELPYHANKGFYKGKEKRGCEFAIGTVIVICFKLSSTRERVKNFRFLAPTGM